MGDFITPGEVSLANATRGKRRQQDVTPRRRIYLVAKPLFEGLLTELELEDRDGAFT